VHQRSMSGPKPPPERLFRDRQPSRFWFVKMHRRTSARLLRPRPDALALAASPRGLHRSRSRFRPALVVMVIFTTIVLAALSLLIWPFRTLWRIIRRRKRVKPWIRRLIVVASMARRSS